MCSLAVAAKCGGSATRATNGRPTFPAATMAQAALSAPAKKSSPAKTISPASIPSSLVSGTRRRMALCGQTRSPHPATRKSGGSATKATNTGPSSPAAHDVTAVAHIAKTSKSCRDSTISPQNIQRSQPNGTQPKTAPSHPTRCSPAAGERFGGSAKTATAGKPSSIPAQARRTAAVRSALAMPLASAARATRRILKRWKNENEQLANKEEDTPLLRTSTARARQCALVPCRYNVDDYGSVHDSLSCALLEKCFYNNREKGERHE